jgi:hypothetical protein
VVASQNPRRLTIRFRHKTIASVFLSAKAPHTSPKHAAKNPSFFPAARSKVFDLRFSIACCLYDEPAVVVEAATSFAAKSATSHNSVLATKQQPTSF